jgi:Tfp pilus assembly protein PilN
MSFRINLLTKKELSLADKLVYFSLNYLRYIIVITQLVIIFVFFYRFQLDQKIIDLKEAVAQKKEIIQVVLPLLSEAEIIEKKQEAAKSVLERQEKMLSMFKYFVSIFPQGLILKEMRLSVDSIEVLGVAFLPENLQNFINLVKKEKKFKKVNLKSIKKNEAFYEFELEFSQFL